VHVVDATARPLEQWRPGVRTRMLISAACAAQSLCLFEQFVEPGCGAPTHTHSVEEVLSVLAGTAQVWVGEEHAALSPGQSVIVPAGLPHGFQNVGTGILHVQATLAAPYFEARFDAPDETRRRWHTD
jgi:quercetin dioxygenase-like cupin family protein